MVGVGTGMVAPHPHHQSSRHGLAGVLLSAGEGPDLGQGWMGDVVLSTTTSPAAPPGSSARRSVHDGSSPTHPVTTHWRGVRVGEYGYMTTNQAGEEKERDMAIEMCEHHWQGLRDRIETSPVRDLVCESGEELVRKGGDDPLLYAMTRIANNFVGVLNHQFGMSQDKIMATLTNRDDHLCPICWVNETCTCGEDECANWWLDYATQDTLDQYARI